VVFSYLIRGALAHVAWVADDGRFNVNLNSRCLR